MAGGDSHDSFISLRDFGPSNSIGNSGYKPTPSDDTDPPGRISIDSSGSIRIRDEGKDHSKEERRKTVVIGRSRSTAFRYFIQFHLLPVTAAIVLIVLNIKTRFLSAQSQWSNLLQFAAKFHEILMQVSITATMIGYQQYLLTQSKSAVPFGAIFSAYYTTQIGYLWSKEFWATLTAQFSLLLKTSFVFFVPASILLAAAVGPASAIAMLPRFVNYTQPDYLIGLNLTYGDIFPMEFTQPGWALDSDISDQNEQSPALGWEYLRSLPSIGQDQLTLVGTQTVFKDLGNGGGSGTVDEMPPYYQIELLTVLHLALSAIDEFKRTLYVQYAPNGTVATVQQVPIAAGLYDAALNSLQGAVGFTSDSGSSSAQASMSSTHPFVSSICMLNPVLNGNDTRPLSFPLASLSSNATGVDTVSYANITRQQLWNLAQSQESGQGQMIWVDDVPFDTSYTLGVIIVQPDLCDNGEKYLSTSACAVSGVWANITTKMTVQTGGTLSPNTVGYNNKVESVLSTDFLNTIPSAWPNVSLSRQWADSITSQISNQNRTVADNLLRYLLLTENLCPPNASYASDPSRGYFLSSGRSRPVMHEALVSALVANGMSHAAGPFAMSDYPVGDGYFQWANFSGDVVKPPATTLTIHSSVQGYAWNIDGTAIKIAIPILMIYIIYATFYVAYTLITGHSSPAWDTISSITALAFNSRPSKVLENTSVRISQTETYRNLLSVQEVEAEQRLELVFQQDEQDRAGLLRRVRAGKAYW